MELRYDVIVVGGGAAGLMAAGTAAENGRTVLLLEKNDRLGKKLRITGKGRCNLTNQCDLQTLLDHIPTNPRFLYGAFCRMDSAQTIRFFEDRGLAVKTERGNRVFPVSDKASDVADTLIAYCKENGVVIRQQQVDRLLLHDQTVEGVLCGDTRYFAQSVIVATGGCSYPLTGSTGDGYGFAEAAGHTIIPLTPSLVPLIIQEEWCKQLQGLSLKNVTLTVTDTRTGKQVYQELGEMLFTHFGISGPLVLSCSAHMKGMQPNQYRVSIDLKPGLDEKQLDNRLLRDFNRYANRDFENALGDLLPRKLIPIIVLLSGISAQKKVNQLSREERRALLDLIKGLTMTVSGFRPVAEAIITSGGVKVSEVNPKTMESKQCRGLFFAGEVLDVDAYTGGFNLQIAFSTGHLAGSNA